MSLTKTAGKIFSILLIAGLLAACNKVNPPYVKTQKTVATFANARNVLVEEFTGHLCTNCPLAASYIESYYMDSAAIKGRIIPVSIHGTFLGDVHAKPFNYNFETAAGNDYVNTFGVTADPTCMFNRSSIGGNILQLGSPGENTAWYADIKSFMNDTAAANIYIAVSNFISAPKVQATIYVNVNWLSNLTGNYNLCLEYTEDSIVNYQMMPGNIENSKYVFNHVLRGSFLPDFGLQIGSNPSAATSWSGSYNCTLDSALVPKNCHIIAFVIKSASNQVVQAQQANLVP